MQRGILACAVVALAVLQAEAACPNSCSGRGTCSTNDQCTCYQGFRGNSCEQRVCPYGRAWATTPTGDLNGDGDRYDAAVYQPGTTFTSRAHVFTVENMGGAWEFWPSWASDEEGHFDMECSNAGLCDRELGQCTCFEGFEGAACDRSTCPGGNYCNGNGRCMTIAQQVTEYNRETSSSRAYDLWDADQMRTCKCDPGFGGIGCEDMLCPKGDDPMTKNHQIPETQRVRIFSSGVVTAVDPTETNGDLGLDGTFTLTFKNHFGQSFTTAPIDIVHYDGTATADAVATNTKAALEALPNSHIPTVDVTAGYCESVLAGTYTTAWAADGDATQPTSGLIRCPGGGAPDALVLYDGSALMADFNGAVNGATLGATPTAQTAATGCTQVTYSRCIELTVTFKDPANSGSLEKLTVDVTSVTSDSKTNAQDSSVNIQATVDKTWSLTADGDVGYVEGSSAYIAATGTNTVTADLTNGDITFNTDAATKAMPVGATVRLYCGATVAGSVGDVSTYTYMGKYVLDATVAASATSVSFTSAINDPKGLCNTHFATVILDTDYIVTEHDWQYTGIANTLTYPALSLNVGGTALSSIVNGATTFSTPTSYLLLKENLSATSVAATTQALTANGAGTKEADECGGRGLCDYSTGLCTCFKGYTGERCDSQNALWVGAEA